MLAFEFNSVVDNNAILIPKEYRGKIHSPIRVIVLANEEESRAEKQRKALENFWEETQDCNEPLGSEFDEILSHRVNISREIDI